MFLIPYIMSNVVRMAAENVAWFLRGEKISSEIRREGYTWDDA